MIAKLRESQEFTSDGLSTGKIKLGQSLLLLLFVNGAEGYLSLLLGSRGHECSVKN